MEESSSTDVATAHPESRAAWTLRGVMAETLRGFRADRGLDLAGSLAFTTLLTAVPLLATFSLFLVGFFEENDDEILAVLNAVIPYPRPASRRRSANSSSSRRPSRRSG